MSGAAPPRVAVVVFPGSNCDEDAARAARNVLQADVKMVRHDERALGDPDLVILPGGFAYGDYLRSGAMARFSPVMESVAAFAGQGGAVLGICNGFQILCEAALLPGAMLRNAGLRFVCRDVFLRIESKRTPFTLAINKGDVLEDADRARRGELDRRAARARGDDRAGSDRLPLREERRLARRRREPERLAGRRGGYLQRERATSSASCRTPSAPREELLGGTDGARLFKSFATTRMAMHGA